MKIALSLIIALVAAITPRAEDDPQHIASKIPSAETGSERDHFTGDWGGLRTRMLEQGVHFYAGYAGEVMGNVTGGLKQGAVFSGLLELGLDLETKRLWSGGLLHASSIYPHGPSLTDRYVGDVLRVSNIDAEDSFRLYELWFEQAFVQDRVSIRAGQVAADEEFATSAHSDVFLNSGFGWPAFVSANIPNGGSAFFVPGLGARLKVKAAENLEWLAAVFDGDTFDDATGTAARNRRGTHWRLDGDQGLLAMTELALHKNYDSPRGELPASYKIGAWLHTADAPDLREDVAGGSSVVSGLAPRAHNLNFGLYFGIDQFVWREESESETPQGAAVFLRAGVSPEDRSLMSGVVNGGLTYTGLFPGCDEDRLGLGFIYARVSRDLRASERDDRDINGAPIRALSDYETVFEFTYECKLKSWWTIQPDVQFIVHPGGSRALPNALVIGARTAIVF